MLGFLEPYLDSIIFRVEDDPEGIRIKIYETEEKILLDRVFSLPSEIVLRDLMEEILK